VNLIGNKTKSTITGSGIVSRSTTVEYSTDGKFPVKTTNALGHFETKTFDAKTGNVLTLTGPNGLTTTWEYDVLGRQAKETRADGTTTTTNYEWWTVLESNYRHAIIYKMTTTISGFPPKTTYFNALNQKVKEQHTGFDGRKIISDVYYDDLGRVKQASLPYFEDEKKYFVTTEYDAIGRVISTTKPADNGKTATSTISYNGLSTTTTNALGHQKTITKNIIDKVIRIDEPKNARLTHHYNSIGKLIKTVVGGVTTTMKYDIRGNKIKMNDPDMGTWTVSFSPLVVSVVDLTLPSAS
jgi:YD repeat-containing protein